MTLQSSYYVDHWSEWPFPVMSVPSALNPFETDGVELFVALACHLPYENIKFLTGLGLLVGAKESGALDGVNTLVEATSGNTGVVLSEIAKSFGDFRVKLVVAPDVPSGKRDPLVMAGAELIYPEEGLSGIATARKLGKQEGWFNLDQYANMDGTKLHTSFTGPKILEKLEHPPTVAVLGVGTGGTLVGISKCFRQRLEKITMVGVLLSPGQEIPGVRDLNRMKEITLPWRESLDEIVEVSTRPSYLASEWFNWQMGITIGPSSGFAYLGALKFLREHKAAGTLDSLRDGQGKIPIVILGPDGNRPYGDRFMTHLLTDCLKPSTAPLPWKFPGDELW